MKSLWEKNYELAKKYFKEHGNLLIPVNYEINDIKLGQWIQNQRQFYKGKKRHKLTDYQINKLNDINMSWDIFSDTWMKNYKLAENYYNNNNSLIIPSKYEVDNVKLGIWIQTQRQNYFKKKLTNAQINMLEKIGMVWDVFEFNWEKNYELAKQYFKKHGNLLIPINYIVNNIKLGSWIQMQRQAYKGNVSSRLSEDKINKLEEIGMVWNISIKEEF